MKVSKKDLQKIIKEEINSILSEINGPKRVTNPEDLMRTTTKVPPVKVTNPEDLMRTTTKVAPVKKVRSKAELASAQRLRDLAMQAQGSMTAAEAGPLADLQADWDAAAAEAGSLNTDPEVVRYLNLLKTRLRKISDTGKKK